MKTFYINNVLFNVENDNKQQIKDFISKDDKYKYVVCLVNNMVRELTFPISLLPEQAKISLLGLDSKEGGKAYEGTLRMIIAYAFHNLYPDIDIRFSYNVSRAIFCEFVNHEKKMNHFFDNIKQEVERIIESDYPIIRKSCSYDEVKEIFTKQSEEDKIEVIKNKQDMNLTLYSINGYYNFMYSLMLPSTGYIKNYVIRPYSPGLIIQYPRYELDAKIPNFVEETIYGRTLRHAAEWGRLTKTNTIEGINSKIGEESSKEFILTCEAKHSNMLAELGQKIKDEMDLVRLICIAGPSSSGKTTFCNRLRIELMSRGINPVMISLDDYYLPKAEIARIQNTDLQHLDLEDVNCLDIELFNKNLYDLINGDTVTLPKFNFETGLRENGRTLKLDDGMPIMIEGIHALNESITSSIPKHQKYKVYISPQMQINIDNHSPLSTTDLRLIRRIVRDKNFRNCPGITTIKMWGSVRQGEFKWIYPNQEEANYVFNSELTYELCVLKKYAIPELMSISKDQPEYITAKRLLRYLSYFTTIDDTNNIPCNSIIREFIGGSCFNV